ncbi:response regulator receiver sensor signal transduction histidine kinase [Desulfovibrio sp. TomC]|nr:response regulator receiver sensor signal transduction histidine kinase [Desulfovibrio sp. TomC]
MLMRPKSVDNVSARFLNDFAEMIYLRLDNSGRILEANNFAKATLQPDPLGLNFSEIFVAFTQTIDPLQAAQNEMTHVPASVNTCADLPRTFFFSFFKVTEGVDVYGEASGTEVLTLQKTLIETNNELSNMTRQLQKNNSELQKLNDIKNQFLGMAAHDLRNPIGAIIAYSDFVMDEAKSLTDEQKEFLSIIKNSSNYMLKLLDDLLDFSKIEAGKLGLDLSRCDYVNFVKRVVKLNSAIAAKKHIQIILNVHEVIPELDFDSIKIEQVLNNILSNALKYSLRNTTIVVNMFMSGDFVTVEVRDQGVGIPKDKIDLIFQPFTRVSKQGTEGERSTGLGLAIVRRIVLGHRGRIWVESSEGEGSTFYFTLPVVAKE